MKKYDYLIIGAGIIGLAIARRLRHEYPECSILVIDKEEDVAKHASSRNSGVLHAGFYYTSDSLKAKFTVEGNHAMKDFCRQHHLKLNECGKLVVAKNEEELTSLKELHERGQANGCNIELIDEGRSLELQPNVSTCQQALYSPDTASIDPRELCLCLYEQLKNKGVDFSLNTAYLEHSENVVTTNAGDFQAGHIVNCAGLYADKIAAEFGFSQDYTIIPFKGLYLKYTKDPDAVGMHIYPVPNLKNPFLGVHFTKTVDGGLTIGPTAIPAFWRENYRGLRNFKLGEMLSILTFESRLFASNTFGFRDLALEEIKKYNKKYFVELAHSMVQEIDPDGFTEWSGPGIRAQLFDKRHGRLVQDFVVEGNVHSTHILNAVSPAFTCAFVFAHFVVQKYLQKSP